MEHYFEFFIPFDAEICKNCGLSKYFIENPDKVNTKSNRPIINGSYICVRWNEFADRYEEIEAQLLFQSGAIK